MGPAINIVSVNFTARVSLFRISKQKVCACGTEQNEAVFLVIYIIVLQVVEPRNLWTMKLSCRVNQVPVRIFVPAPTNFSGYNSYHVISNIVCVVLMPN